MINIKKINNEIKITYNTQKGVKTLIDEYKPFKIKNNPNGNLSNLKGDLNYEVADDGDYAFTCLYNKKYKKDNIFLNTSLLLSDSFLTDLTSPKLVFYDIETNEYAKPKRNSVSSDARINSIAWIDADTGEEFCLVSGVDGLEGEIIERFIDYCKSNHIMVIVGHNSYGFDNIVMMSRMKELKFSYDDISIFYNQCNLDTMVLASFLQYSSYRLISLIGF